MALKVSLPRHWEDWINLILGIWLFASPWVLRFASTDITANQNAFLIGILLVVANAVMLSAFRVWEEWFTVALGAWLVISPWVLGITGIAATANFVIVGLIVLALSLYEVWDVRRQSAHPA
jgi:SPW repeat